ncbi:sugar ABC transporter substrate-binding protein [Mesorhizobium comanense]|uniref:sugar ABC transporter substrate-binding protein n=1 Tax=Mesorhizobium comanense TaxID=2502215 RepID=UPI0010F84793|nr:sugar ABC transporter substrate-binding protein [Mesorhizobium comanense]
MKTAFVGAISCALLSTVALTVPAYATDAITACLVTKTDVNPFFVKMKEGATAKAKELGIRLMTFAGKQDGDADTQIAAIESCIGSGAKGILLTPNDSSALVPVITKAREAGLLTIMLDTPLDPANAADATFATDNFKAGELIGKWAAGKLGPEAKNARIALLNLNPQQITVDYMRNQGFLKGFGIDIKNPTRIGDEDDPRIVGNAVTNANEEGGRSGMESLLQIDPDINLVYTINEPTAAGAYEAIKAAGRQGKVTVVSVDGGCPGVANIKEGVIGATSMQFPLLMASMGVEAIKTFAETGKKPEVTPGLDFFNTGVELITDQPVDGLPSITSEEGLKKCWG